MKETNSTLQMLFLVLLFSHIPQTLQEQVETKAADDPEVELSENKEKSAGFGKLPSAKSASEQETILLSDGRMLERGITSDRSYSNAETTESSASDGTVKPAREDPTKTLQDAKSSLDAPGMSSTEASGMVDAIEKPVDNVRIRSSYSSGSSSDDDDDDDEEGDEDEASGTAVIVVSVAVGVIVVLAVIVLAIWWCRKRRREQRQSKVRYREVSQEAAAGNANEETLLDDTTQNEGA